MDVEAVIIEVAARLDTIAGLDVFDEIPRKLARTPAAIVAWPEAIVFDAGGRRSTDTLMLPIVVCLSQNVARVAKLERALYLGSGGLGAIAIINLVANIGQGMGAG